MKNFMYKLCHPCKQRCNTLNQVEREVDGQPVRIKQKGTRYIGQIERMGKDRMQTACDWSWFRKTKMKTYWLDTPLDLYIPYSLNFRGVSISRFCQILLKNKFSQITFSWSSFQSHLASVMNLKFHERKISQPFSDPRNPWKFQPWKF